MGEQQEEPAELTQDDIHWIHDKRKQDAHEAWLRGRVRVVWPWLVAVVATIVAVGDWLAKHFTLR